MGLHIAAPLQPLEDLGLPPTGQIDPCRAALGEYPGQIFGQATAGDVCHGVQPEFLLQGQQGPVVDGRGFQQGVDQGLSVIEFLVQRCTGYLNDLSYQEKPLACGPLEGSAISASPSVTWLPSMIWSFSTTPTQNPARS